MLASRAAVIPVIRGDSVGSWMGGMVGIVFGSDGAVERNGVLGGVMGERGESSFMIVLDRAEMFRLVVERITRCKRTKRVMALLSSFL